MLNNKHKYVKSILILFFIVSIPASAQNLLSNPNFSSHSSCPYGIAQFYKCDNWYRPSSGTADYLNACDTISAGVPRNIFGYQISTSNAYAGIICYFSSGNYREYIATDIQSLHVGSSYRVTVFTSLAENSGVGVDGLGVLFFINRSIDTVRVHNFFTTPQVDYTSYGTISDAINWVMLTDTFIADSEYTHLIIGNFKDDASTQIDTLERPYKPYAYYYIDSVAVEEIDTNAALSVKQQEQIKLMASPNPFTNQCKIHIGGNVSEPIKLILTDHIGRVIRVIDGLSTDDVTINRNDLAVGLYFYTIQTMERILGKGKLVIF